MIGALFASASAHEAKRGKGGKRGKKGTEAESPANDKAVAETEPSLMAGEAISTATPIVENGESSTKKPCDKKKDKKNKKWAREGRRKGRKFGGEHDKKRKHRRSTTEAPVTTTVQ